MSDPAARYHEEWLGLVQPTDGLVVSIPVLVEAEVSRPANGRELQARLEALCSDGESPLLRDLDGFLAEILGLGPDLVARGEAVAPELALIEAQQTVRPTHVLRAPGEAPVALLWDLPPGLPLDRPETITGGWEHPPSAKLDRLLRAARVPIGMITNREAVRLLYAPHGESSGSITFRVADMLQSSGRPILEALVMLLGETRLFGVAEARSLPAILAASRAKQAEVTERLADQVLDALTALLDGFAAAGRRDGTDLLADHPDRPDPGEHVYGGLLSALLRSVFVLYAEDTGLLPVERPLYSEHMSLLGLHEELQADAGAYPDAMSRRFGAWGRLLALWRAIHEGVEHGDLRMPPRRGELFDPGAYPFLESASGEVASASQRPEARVPTIDDGTVWKVLDALVRFDGQRLSYRALDVEQIGSVYEALMGYRVMRVSGPAACLGKLRVWVAVDELREQRAAARAGWLKDTCGLDKARAERLVAAFADAEGDDAALGAMSEFAVRNEHRAPRIALAGALVLQPGAERRRTSSHYTPRSLTAPIVARTLEPLLATLGPSASSEQLLSLKVCDPAMGSGAFLVEACRFLADRVLDAWTREGTLDRVVKPGEDPVMHARRLVAQRCLYGVDKNRYAVGLAKLSLWLVTLAKELPFTFLDHALRHGDSLVGLDLEQIVSFHWEPGLQVETCRIELEATLGQAIEAREKILALAADESPGAVREKEWLLRDAEDALDRVRLIGDLVVGAYFSATRDRARETERNRRRAMVEAWLAAGGDPPDELRLLQAEIRARIPVFHWWAEYPEVFWAQRPDPLAAGAVDGQAWIDAFVGNPPFMGGNTISGAMGADYIAWLLRLFPNSHGNSDYCAYFFRRTAALIGKHGTIGLIATNTISQGDTRTTALQPLLRSGHQIAYANRSLPWPGQAAVEVSVVHLVKGSPGLATTRRELDGQQVAEINSRLRPGRDLPDPAHLATNDGLSFKGVVVLGSGFMLDASAAEELRNRDPKNGERIYPFLGGEEVNTHPQQSSDRYAINFGMMSLEEAERWPDLIAIVREKVKPERDNNPRETRKRYWWRFGEASPALFAAISALPRCLVTAQVTKHLCFSFQPTTRVFSQKLFVFPFSQHTQFAILQSRLHVFWAWRLSATMKTDLSYSTTDCFENFPFAQPDPRSTVPALEAVGARLYESRAQYMAETAQGLTKTYNALKDALCRDQRIFALRALHEDLDRAVLGAYGWADIAVPPYCPITEGDAAAIRVFEETVLDRLFALNATRAAEEARS